MFQLRIIKRYRRLTITCWELLHIERSRLSSLSLSPQLLVTRGRHFLRACNMRHNVTIESHVRKSNRGRDIK